MQYRPDAPTLLAAVADVLDDVLGDVPADKQHRVRVAAHLTRLVEREVRLGGDAAEAELAALVELLGDEASDVADVSAGNERLAARLRQASDVDQVAVWNALAEIVRGDLDIAKPSHADWTGT